MGQQLSRKDDKSCHRCAHQQVRFQRHKTTSMHLSRSVSSELYFPMHVIAVETFQHMQRAEPHQVLRSRGDLVEFEQGMGVVVFVSHQWCSRSHPDPEFRQLKALQHTLRQIARGAVDIDLDYFTCTFLSKTQASYTASDIEPSYLWYDYFSIPQPEVQVDQPTDLHKDMGKAVWSIPAYVELCDLFVVLAPLIQHAGSDFRVSYQTWKGRAWCRLEQAARVLSPADTRVLVVTGGGSITEASPLDYILDPPGDASLSVEADRQRIADVMVKLFQGKLKRLAEANSLHKYRMFLSLRGILFRGLNVDPAQLRGSRLWSDGPPPADVTDTFLREFGFLSAVDGLDGVAMPIHCAAMRGEEVVLEGLLRRRADVNSRTAADPEFLIHPAMQPLHLAAGRGGGVAAVRCLLDHKARVDAANVLGQRPLLLAAEAGATEVVRFLLARRAGVDRRDRLGASPACVAGAADRAATLALLLRARASVAAAPGGGLTALHVAAMLNASKATTVQLLDAGCDTNAVLRPMLGSPLHTLSLVQGFQYRWRKNPCTPLMLHFHIMGTTALMIAAILGSAEVAHALLDRDARRDLRNGRGFTAAELAERAGHAALTEDIRGGGAQRAVSARELPWERSTGELPQEVAPPSKRPVVVSL